MSHSPIVSATDAARVRGRPFLESLHRSAKALILRSEGRFFQFVIPGDSKLDFKKAKSVLNTSSLSLATPEEVKELTDCTVGSVPPFGNLWSVPVFADLELSSEIDFSAGLHEKSMTVSREDWASVVEPVFVDVADCS